MTLECRESFNLLFPVLNHTYSRTKFPRDAYSNFKHANKTG